MRTALDVRPSPIAGQWYPGNARELAATVDAYLGAARFPPPAGVPVAIVAPHAGHRYSGPVAGYAFRAARPLAPDLAVVVGPMHYPWAADVVTSAHDAYGTPLGTVPIDADAVRDLAAELRVVSGVELGRVRKDPEHSVEIQLPFLQRTLASDFRILPVMVRTDRRDIARGLGRALATVVGCRRALLVASTDLSHYYPHPIACDLDAEVLRRVEALDPDAVLSVEQEGKGYACGLTALGAVLWAARDLGANAAKILRHATSGETTGDYESVVGYGAAVVTTGHADDPTGHADDPTGHADDPTGHADDPPGRPAVR
jgi:MEMO1 family protein